ncbi:MAG: hypothetical protein ACR2LK_05395 [Solirubrobacteraceae bacterium]
MTKAITVRLDETDHAALETQARQVGVRPGTLARMLVHTGLSADDAAPKSVAASAALERLVRRSEQQRVSGDAVALVAEARAALDPER